MNTGGFLNPEVTLNYFLLQLLVQKNNYNIIMYAYTQCLFSGVIMMEGGTEHDLLSLVNQESDKEDSKGVEEEKVVETASEGAETEEGIEKEPHIEHVQDSPKKGYYYTLQQSGREWHWCNFQLA